MLVAVLAINAVMFVLEFGAGVIAGSAALMADAADMLGDALVYAVSLYALARSDRRKAGAAMFKGVFILALGVGIAVNVALKIRSGVPPSSTPRPPTPARPAAARSSRPAPAARC